MRLHTNKGVFMITSDVSRRSLLTGAAATFQIIRPELVRGAGKERLKAGLVGCGGRGRQAAIDLMNGSENVDLVAMADILQDDLDRTR